MNLVLLGGAGGQLYQPDALADYGASAETSARLHFKSKPYAPLGMGGDCVFRRIYLGVEYATQVAFTVTPYVDGQVVSEGVTYFHRSDGPARTALVVAFARRGSNVQVEITATAPRAQWTIESLTFAYRPALRHRRSA